MSGYLPLCAFRQGLLPEACRCCAWWLTAGGMATGTRPSPVTVADIRRRWMTSLEGTWGTPGLLLEGGGAFSAGAPAPAAPAPTIAASIHLAPSAAVPRLRDLPFSPLPEGSALLFCLTCAEGQPRYQAKRILQKALRQLKAHDVLEVYAVAAPGPCLCGSPDGDRCRFFPSDLLSDNGFELIRVSGELLLMRVDLRGLLSVIGRVKAAVRQALGDEPAPSPAAWTRREVS